MHYGTPPPYIAEGLIELRKRIDEAAIPPSTLDQNLNIATWNIREFGKTARLDASIYYIAEILNQFDLIALTELRDNLDDLERVMRLLGNEWQIVFSDYTNDRGGNKERIAYLFDNRMVKLTGLVAEADPPRKKVKGEYLPKYTWWRPPYMASFRAGNFDFVVLTAHIRWGNSIKERIHALGELNKWIKKRKSQIHATDMDFIVMGDFNIPKHEDAAHKALTGNGRTLKVPEGLKKIPGSNLSKRANYDQILHSPTHDERFSGRGDVLDFYRDLGGAENWKALYPESSHRPKNKQKFTFELSDHFPLWLQVNTEIVDQNLQRLAKKS